MPSATTRHKKKLFYLFIQMFYDLRELYKKKLLKDY